MKLKDETGLAFPLVLIIVLVLTILGVTLYVFSTTETRQVLLDENKMKAHYIARSGAHAVAAYIIENPSIAGALAEAGESEPYSFAGGFYRVEVGEFIDDNNGGEGDVKEKYVVKSTGTYNNISQRIEVTVENVGVSGALYANKFTWTGGSGTGNLEVSGGDIIAGGVEGEAYSCRDTVEGFLTDDHIFMDNTPIDWDPVKLPCDPENELDFENCEGWGPGGNFDGNNLTVTENSRYDNIYAQNLYIESDVDDLLLRANKIQRRADPPGGGGDLASGTDIHVTLSGNNTVVIVADTFRPENVTVVSNDDQGGYLLIYAHEYLVPEGNSKYTLSDNCHLNVYIYDIDGVGGRVNLTGVPNFEGAIYAPTARSFLTGTAQITGWVITDEIIIGGGGTGGIDHSDIKMRDTGINFDFFNIERWRYVGN